MSRAESPAEIILTRTRVGAGSFAAVYTTRYGRVAYKEVHTAANTTQLKSEYKLLARLHRTCNGTSFFSLPRAFAYCEPQSDAGALFISESTGNTGPPAHFPAATAEGPSLCRLYLGKIFDRTGQTARPRFFSTANFPLDEARYEALRGAVSDLPTLSEVAQGMGAMLALLHFRGLVDARDVEFVLGGDGYGDHTFYVIDFNQVRPFDPASGSVEPLVDAFFSNDPYYPRPRHGNPLYTEFKDAYLTACPDETRELAQAFIQTIEQKQAERDIQRDM
ncbi:hypothetical protein GGX14DRAFT_368238 [Mycena pura]|uniref:DUF3669 domain-containing protein n=1 Tax=Mycena pura TaxID=153505 RepID=A0AAD6VBV4_9AGAR|nr:hypothetical protein GGX14DRAFT_368238 [Mycena pura]